MWQALAIVGERYFDLEEYYDSIEVAKIEKSRAS